MFASNTSQVSSTNGALAEAIDFTYPDYLEKTTALTGGTNVSAFTLSVWLWPNSGDQIVYQLYNSGFTQLRFYAYYQASSGNFSIIGRNSSNLTVLDMYVPLGTSSGQKTFYNILISVDLTNSANRSVYINDLAVTATWATYSNNTIDFTQVNNAIAYGAGAFDGRISHFFLDFTYRNLATTANRRLFVTADLKPAAGQAALNPIMYFTMADPTQPGKNSGTGGDFTLNGVVARSGRGPNQYNAPYIDLNGSSQYLNRTSAITGLSDSAQVTLAFVFNGDTISKSNTVLKIGSASRDGFMAEIGYGTVTVYGKDASGTTVLGFSTSFGQVAGRNYHIVMSFDLADTSKRWVYVNGDQLSVSYTNYANSAMDLLQASPIARVGSSLSSVANLFDGRIGALWFNTSYIDLSVPSNLAKFVSGTGINAKPVDLGSSGELPTGTSPLIYLPMYANNAGKNYGTGGDFTAVATPIDGARGPNEFWGNKMQNASGGASGLTRSTALSGVSASKTASISYTLNVTYAGYDVFWIESSASGQRFAIYVDNTTPKLKIVGYNAAGTVILNATGATTLSTGVQYTVQICFDLSNAAKRFVYINGSAETMTWSTYTNDFIAFNANTSAIAYSKNITYLTGWISEFYFSTSYIDFSQEANRLLFRDAFGNPVDLSEKITAGTISTPAIYMRFPPTAFGANSGSGGNFTVTGTGLTDGGQL